MDLPAPSALHERAEHLPPWTIGVEEELMLLDPLTLELVPSGPAVLERLTGDARFKLELPASQLEIALGPYHRVDELASALGQARREVAAAADGVAVPAAAGVHPFSAGIGELTRSERYEHTLAEYGLIAQRQLVCALQVHVAVGGAERTLAVYNALRSYLPHLAALAANAPFYEGRDCGLASVRPKLAGLLPRQGVPPALESWEHYVRELEWGVRAGAFPGPRTWWWELRPHVRFGTLELRVPDAQTTVPEAAAVIAVAHAVTLWLADRYDAGEQLPVAPTWRIEENRWSACRHGIAGVLADLENGHPRPTEECLRELLEVVEPLAVRHGGQAALAHAGELISAGGGAARQRAAAAGPDGVHGLARWLTEQFLGPDGG